jgi:hypothetical protein
MDKRLLFSIFYKTVFTILTILFLALLLITPADAIKQALDNNQLYNVFVIAGSYLVTVLFAITIYASRLWTSKTVLKGIPKTYIPVEKDDVGERVRKMIAGSLNRSAAIAWDFRPRVDSQLATEMPEPDARDPVVRTSEPEEERKWLGIFRKHRSKREKDDLTVVLPPFRPAWGDIAHDGWSSPLSPDLPNLQYTSVIHELPHLVEARAVSLAPSDPDSTSNPPMPDIRAVDLLQRPLSMGLRDYTEHLIRLEVVASPSTATAFLDAYEYARFSTRPLTEPQFRDLMKLFAELLRSMQALSPAMLTSLDNDASGSDIDDDNSSTSTPRTRSMVSFDSSSTRSGSEGTIRTARSRPAGTSRASTTQKSPKYSAARASSQTKKRPRISRSASANSFAQSKRPYNGSSSPSSESLGSSSQGSVIRLNPSHEEGELPYTLTIAQTR